MVRASASATVCRVFRLGTCHSSRRSSRLGTRLRHGSRFNFVVTAAQKFRGQGGVGPMVRWFRGSVVRRRRYHEIKTNPVKWN